MKRARREQNPLRTHDRGEGIEHDKTLTSPEWGSRIGNEQGYNERFGPYGSIARGWVDRPHERSTTYEGQGPKRQRSDEWLLEEISELLMRDGFIDASEIEIEVKDGDVTASGSVPERFMKYRTEDLIEGFPGVKNVNIKLKVIHSDREHMI